jgi:hypothetical protein
MLAPRKLISVENLEIPATLHLEKTPEALLACQDLKYRHLELLGLSVLLQLREDLSRISIQAVVTLYWLQKSFLRPL